MRAEHDVAVTGPFGIEVDARDVADHPGADVAQKNMVDRRVAELGRQGPRLGQRREALLDPPSPRGAVLLRGHLVGYVAVTVARQHAQGVLAAERAEVEMEIVVFDRLGQIVGHTLLVALGHDAESQRDGQRGLRAVGVRRGGRVEVDSVDRLADTLGFLPERSGVAAGQFRETAHQRIVEVVEAARRIGRRRLRLVEHPVADTVSYQPRRILAGLQRSGTSRPSDRSSRSCACRRNSCISRSG